MRCRTCDYRLWNLRSRQCPECGTAFQPSDFQFVPNTVRFCCPDCAQAYYGTDANGHLVPASFSCIACGRALHMDDTVVLPAEGVEEEKTSRDSMPWLERSQRGFLRGWWSTVGCALVRPAELLRSVPPSSSMLQAWWFAAFTSTLTYALGLSPILLFSAVMAGAGTGPKGLEIALMCAVVVLMFGAGTLLFIVLWGWAAHGMLRLIAQPAHPLGRTFQTLCYSSGANVTSATPCIGFSFGWIWWLVSAVVGLKEAQRVSGWKAAWAVLILPVVTFLITIGLYAIFLYYAVTSGTAFSTKAANRQEETEIVCQAILDFAADHGNEGPAHGIQLALDGYLDPIDFVANDTDTLIGAVPLGDANLEAFDQASSEKKKRMAQALAATHPKKLVAHRLGDFVFTHHGIDLSKASPELWVVIWSPDPDTNTALGLNDMITLGQADGKTINFFMRGLGAMLTMQNVLRQQQGLPPLPDPSTVTHKQPATTP